MSTPGIELRWGKGFEDPRKREQVRPVLLHAREYALDSLAYLGLSLKATKQAVIRAPEKHGYLAEMSGTSTIRIFLPAYWSKMTEQNAITIASLKVHEIVHIFWAESSADDDARWRAATEGLAYVAQNHSDEHLHNLFGNRRPQRGIVEQVNDMPKRMRQAMRQDFLQVTQDVVSWSDKLYKEWCIKSVPDYGISRSEIVGIDAVSRQEQAGWKIAELIASSSAKEVLGVNQF